MIKYNILILIFALIFCITPQTYAQETNTPPEQKTYTGLAMNGLPKHDASAAHLDYANPDAPKGGHLKTATIGTFDTVNPYTIKGVAAEGLNLVYDRLMQRAWNEPFTLYPLIAESADVPEDRSSITLHLNHAARFNDGSPITAHDVKFSFETLRDHGRPNMQRIYKLVDTVKITDDRTISFTLKQEYDRETIMIIAMMPVLSQSWWKDRNFEDTLLEAPLSNGPYEISEIEQGRRITYKRVPDYWAKDLMVNTGHFNFDTITYDYFRDDTIALESFKKGELNLRREWDISKWESAYSDIDHARIAMLEAPHQRPERAHGMIFNLRRQLFQDINVRKALSLAFDADWVKKNLYYNKFQRIKSFFPNSALDGSMQISEQAKKTLEKWKETLSPSVFNDTLDITDTRPVRERLRDADTLLKQAGWIIENGKRINQTTKQPFEFEILISSGSPQEQKIALNFSKSLQRLGITANVRTMDAATLQNRRNEYDYDMLAHYWQNSLSPGTEQMIYWSCKAAQEPARFNFAGICNPALDDLAQNIADTATYEELVQDAQAIDRILLSEYISIPLFYKGQDYIAFDAHIHRPQTTPLYGIVTETWWIGQ